MKIHLSVGSVGNFVVLAMANWLCLYSYTVMEEIFFFISKRDTFQRTVLSLSADPATVKLLNLCIVIQLCLSL